ncbi:WD40-repeat-containing domain protein [Chlamydoabsidia padenii]|nr:WD40-repeat-containing domain protein [Chlamydoabsidia padenii]
MSQTCLNHASQDAITKIVYHSTQKNLLLTSSWDQTLRLYSTTSRRLKSKIQHNSPILDTCFGRDYEAYSAAADGCIYSNNLATGKVNFIGKHSKGAQSVCWSSNYGTLYSGSWDKTLCVWDTRKEGRSTSKYTLNKKISSMDLLDNTLVVALSHKNICVYDIRRMDTPWKTIGTTLRYGLKSVRVMPTGQGIACSSTDGRIEVFSFGENGQVRSYAFKSNSKVSGDREIFYPVNSLSFHPIYGTFASGGSDGLVNVWDPVNQRRVRNFSKFSEEISSVAFNCDGTQLAIASSYTFDGGKRPHASDALYIRHLVESDYKLTTSASKKRKSTATPASSSSM